MPQNSKATNSRPKGTESATVFLVFISSQMAPWVKKLQSQLKNGSPALGLQLPPLLHGSLTHGEMSHTSPEKPSTHSQTKPGNVCGVLVHTPLFWQGGSRAHMLQCCHATEFGTKALAACRGSVFTRLNGCAHRPRVEQKLLLN